MRKTISLLLVLCLVFGLAACGKKTESAFVGNWTAVKYEFWGEEMSLEDGGEGWLVLNADGTGKMAHMGDIVDVTWKEKKDSISITDGDDADYTCEYDGETLSIDIFGMVMYLVRSETAPGDAEGSTATTPTSAEDEALSGSWYGWWIITDATAGYASSDNNWWDLCADITAFDDGTAVIDLWDEDYSRDDLLGSVNLKLESDTMASSIDGVFCNDNIASGEWHFDADAFDVANYIFIESTYEDQNGSFTYSIHLRPWGQLWDDMDAENRPYVYDDWYLPLIEAGSDMPDTIGGEAVGNGEEQSGAQNSGGQTTAGGLIEIGDGSGLGVAVPSGFSYNEGWSCWSNSDFTISLMLSDATTYASADEMTSALSSKAAKTETIGSYTVHVVEDPENWGGPTTFYYVELGDVAGYAGCRIAVTAREGGNISATQTQDIKNAIASVAAIG